MKENKNWMELKDEIRTLQIATDFGEDLKYYVTVMGLFTKEGILQEFPKFTKLLESYISTGEEEGRLYLLYSIQHFLAKNPEILDYVPTIMKMAYDAELFSEEFLFNWEEGKTDSKVKTTLFKDSMNKKFKKTIQKFLEWLR